MLSADEKVEVRYWLGYSVLEDAGPVQRALDSLDARPEADPFIRRDMQTCRDIDDKLRIVSATALAISTNGVETRAAYALQTLRSQGRQAVGRLAKFLVVPIKGDMFSASTGPGPETNNPEGMYADRPVPPLCS